jgi:hypothetical protein
MQPEVIPAELGPFECFAVQAAGMGTLIEHEHAGTENK